MAISRTQATTGATGIGATSGLPAGVLASWASNTITFSDSPTATITFSYNIPLTGGSANVTGTIEVESCATCTNDPIGGTPDSYTQTGIYDLAGFGSGCPNNVPKWFYCY